MERKDNLTDAVENVQGGTQEQSSSETWEAIAANGELITLGLAGGKTVQVRAKDGMLMMTPKQLKAVIAMTVEQTVDDFSKEVLAQTLKRLDDLNIDKTT